MTHYDDDPYHDHEDDHAGASAIKWVAIVFIVLMILYFLAHYLLPAL